MKSYDILIIGAGPSGIACALSCIKNGLSVCLIDKSVFPREKICAGIITHKVEQELKSIGLKFNCNKTVSSNVNLLIEDTTLLLNSRFGFKFVERKAFDYSLLKQCVQTDVNFIQGSFVKSYNLDKRYIVNSDNVQIGYKYLIIADGVNSYSRKILNEPKLDKNLCLQTFVPKNNFTKYNEYKEVLSLRLIKNHIGYQWFVPHNNGITIGTTLYNNKSSYSKLKKIHDTICKELSINYNYKTQVGYVSSGRYINSNYMLPNNVLFIGEASGLICPITGEGLYYAIVSGKNVASAINMTLKSKLSLVESYNTLNSKVTENIESERLILNKLHNLLVSDYGLINLKSEIDYFSRLIDEVVSTQKSTFRNKYDELCYLLR